VSKESRTTETLKRTARRIGDRIRPDRRPATRTGAFRHALEPEDLQQGHTVDLLVDGDEAFPAMLDAIEAAQQSIWLETYIFESDTIGRIFIEALAKRAREGIEVLILVDAFGGLEFEYSDEDFLRAAGARIVFFGRFNHLDISRWIKRDHRKLLLVDEETAFVGGINISDDYAAPEFGGKGWHDLHIRIQGPVCVELAQVFGATWKRASGKSLTLPQGPRKATEGEWAMALCSNHNGVRMRIRSHLLHAIRHAEEEVLLASAYFVPDRGLMKALENAAGRGVEVRLLVPGESDVMSVQWAGEHSYERLLSAGVSIHTFVGRHMHAKAAVVDRRWATFGSYNLDFASLLYNLELVIEVIGDRSPAALADCLRADFEDSPELDLETWRDRPLASKITSTIAYQFRRIL
jgi:cardiolipin synthase